VFEYLCWLLVGLALGSGPGPLKGVAAACLIRKGMTEEEVTRILGRTFTYTICSGLGSFKDCPDYLLRIYFDDNNRVHSACFVRFVRLPDGFLVAPAWWFLEAEKSPFLFGVPGGKSR
jgi:hypothetical protein